VINNCNSWVRLDSHRTQPSYVSRQATCCCVNICCTLVAINISRNQVVLVFWSCFSFELTYCNYSHVLWAIWLIFVTVTCVSMLCWQWQWQHVAWLWREHSRSVVSTFRQHKHCRHFGETARCLHITLARRSPLSKALSSYHTCTPITT